MATKKPVLELDLPEFYDTLHFVSESLVGDFGVGKLEEEVRELSKVTPFLLKILAAIGEAQRRLDAFRDSRDQDNPELARKFLNDNETFCCLQGSLATFLVVSRILSKQPPSRVRIRKRKK